MIFRKAARLFFGAGLLLSLEGACAKPPQANGETTAAAEVQPPAAEAPSRAEPPAAVLDALIPQMARESSPHSAPGEPRFDVTVDRTPAREFFLSLVEGTSHSLTLSPNLSGEITLSLRNVTVEEVLDTVQQAYGYGYERTRTGYLILPSGLQTQVFRVDYLNLERTGSSETRVSSGQISDQVQNGLGGAGGLNGANGLGGVGGAGGLGGGAAINNFGNGGGSVSGSRVQTNSDSDLWTEILASVESIVGNAEGQSVVASPNAGLLVVRAHPPQLAKVAAYLRSAESSLNRVVILEAKILEVTLNDGLQSGINWAQLATPNNDRILVGQNGGGSVGETGFTDSRGIAQNLGPPLSDFFLGSMGSAFGGVFSLALEVDKFTAFIELLETQGEVRTLSNPRISTVNNQKAVIKVGQDEFFVTDVSTTVVTGTATTSNPNVTLTPFFSGIALDVTPQISEDNDVVLHVHPAVTEVTDQTKTFTLQDQQQVLPLALSSIRESDSIVRAKSGQIVVIGGLIQNETRDTTYGIPWLSRIPWVGRLFSHSALASRRTELVILLRPIVVGESTWGDEQRAASERIQSAYGSLRSRPDPEVRLDGWLPAIPPSSQ